MNGGKTSLHDSEVDRKLNELVRQLAKSTPAYVQEQVSTFMSAAHTSTGPVNQSFHLFVFNKICSINESTVTRTWNDTNITIKQK